MIVYARDGVENLLLFVKGVPQGATRSESLKNAWNAVERAKSVLNLKRVPYSICIVVHKELIPTQIKIEWAGTKVKRIDYDALPPEKEIENDEENL